MTGNEPDKREPDKREPDPREPDPRDLAATRMTYHQPAGRWTDALPLGNGRLGAMYFGGIGSDRLQLNDETCWSGSPQTAAGTPGVRPGAGAAVVEQVRAALDDGDVRLAEERIRQLQGGHSQAYVALGDLWIDQEVTGATDYRRTLDLAAAVAGHTYRTGSVAGTQQARTAGTQQARTVVTQQAWISAPAQALVIRRWADGPGPLPPARIRLDSPHPTFTAGAHGTGIDAMVRMPTHVVPPHEDLPDPVRHGDGPAVTALLGLRVETDGSVHATGDTLTVTGARRLQIVLSTETDYVDPFTDPHGDLPTLRTRLDSRIGALIAAVGEPGGYERLRAEHHADHTALFGRAALVLGDPADAAAVAGLDTGARVRRFAGGAPDPSLPALLFQYGRYLMIASSRPGGLPATLQGIWNDRVRPPWSSNYTTNINLEMNYWPAEVAGLPECHRPLLDWLAWAARRGAAVARDHYGTTGWTLHHNSDAWCFALPAGEGDADPAWSFWPLGAAWLCRHLFDHYDYGRDPDFLREQAWPLVRDAGRFCLEWLVTRPDGTLGTAPSTSPENHFLAADGLPAALSTSTTADLVLIRDLLGRGLELFGALPAPDEGDRQWAELALLALTRIPAERVGADGRLAEWHTDLLDAEPEHRHTSHLFGVYPGDSIDPDRTPELAAAAVAALDARGPKSTGWSLAWRIALRARLRDAAGADEMVRLFLAPMADDASDEPSMTEPAGIYRNLFCAHPPFQIDGNFGFTAGVAELLMQSPPAEDPGTTVVHLVPALPAAWDQGSFRGLRARGGVTVDARWSGGEITEVVLHTTGPRRVVVRIGETRRLVELSGAGAHRVAGDAPR